MVEDVADRDAEMIRVRSGKILEVAADFVDELETEL